MQIWGLHAVALLIVLACIFAVSWIGERAATRTARLGDLFLAAGSWDMSAGALREMSTRPLRKET